MAYIETATDERGNRTINIIGINAQQLNGIYDGLIYSIELDALYEREAPELVLTGKVDRVRLISAIEQFLAAYRSMKKA